MSPTAGEPGLGAGRTVTVPLVEKASALLTRTGSSPWHSILIPKASDQIRSNPRAPSCCRNVIAKLRNRLDCQCQRAISPHPSNAMPTGMHRTRKWPAPERGPHIAITDADKTDLIRDVPDKRSRNRQSILISSSRSDHSENRTSAASRPAHAGERPPRRLNGSASLRRFKLPGIASRTPCTTDVTRGFAGTRK